MAASRGRMALMADEQEVLEEVQKEGSESISSKTILSLRNNKKLTKTRLTKAKNKLSDLIEAKGEEIPLPSKNAVRRAMDRVKCEMKIITNIIDKMRELNAVDEHASEDTNSIIEALDKELDDIGISFDSIMEAATKHLQGRLDAGENESVLSNSETSIHSKVSVSEKMSLNSNVKSKSSVKMQASMAVKEKSVYATSLTQIQLNATQAEDRLKEMEKEQNKKEAQMKKVAAELEISKQRTEEARIIAEINNSKAKKAVAQDHDIVQDCIQDELTVIPTTKTRQVLEHSSFHLKGVNLPKFSGDDKTEYESWKAAFNVMVDSRNISVGEKMLRLQNSLSGKALDMIKDLGFSEAAYERAKVKLDKRFGGERRQQIKHLTTLRNWPKLRSRNLEDLEEFQALLERILINTKNGTTLQDQSLNLSAKEKLAEIDIQNYKHWLLDHAEEDCFESLVDWIELRVNVMEEAKEETGASHRREQEHSNKLRNDKKRHLGFSARSSASKCCIVSSCKEDHPPWVCSAFKALPVAKRKELIAKTSRCFRCLATGHHAKNCSKSRKCGINGCESDGHSSYLHEETSNSASTRSQLSSQSSPFHPNQRAAGSAPHAPVLPGAENAQSRSEQSNGQRAYKTSRADNVSLMVLPAVISNGRKYLQVNVMLDPCSTGSYISEAAANELELKGHEFDLKIAGTGGAEVRKRSKRVTFSVSSPDGKFSSQLYANVLDNIVSDTPAFPWSQLKENWPHLRSIPFETVSKRPCIDVMIGSDHPLLHLVLQEVSGSDPQDPIARLTNLGWVCFGPALVDMNPRRRLRSNFARTYGTSQALTQPQLDDTLRRFWELESIGIRDVKQEMSMEEKNVIEKVANTLSLCDGRYTIGIPWKEEEPKLNNNYEAALVRLQSQERSLKKRGVDIMESYSKIFKDYEQKGYVKKVKEADNEKQWFLPHFPVIRPEKSSTKVRVVFDAAMRYEGKSLNDAIHAGPKLQREVVDVLTRFRRAPVALMADISEMFLQVGLREPDRAYHRFLWREFDTSRDPDVYEFQRLVFGNTASPFCSQYVLHSHAQENKSAFPEAADSVDNAMYVDDLLDSAETVESAKSLQSQLSSMLSAAGFNLRKWASNEPAVLENVPPADRLPIVELSDDESPKTKTLGVMWEASRDVFIFKLKPPDPNIAPTKRTVLSAIASLYDPLQFLSPFVIRAKILMQEIWTEGLNWDDVLPDTLAAKWNCWTSELPDLSKVSIPRCLRLPDPDTVELHLFSDASQVAYGSVAYLVGRYKDLPSTSRIVASKSRVAPLKAVTIPRLELLGAVLSSRLSVSISHVLTVDRIVFWTDAENVYYWVRNQSRLFKPFVANRIAEVQRTSNPEQWRHVPGEMNPADAATRGLTAVELSKSSLWMEGPSFLKCDESCWPPSPRRDAAQVDPEKRSAIKTFTTVVNETEFIDVANYSSLRRLYRVTCWIKRFVHNCRQSSELKRNFAQTLSPTELKEAEEFWIKRCQFEAFPNGVKEPCLTRLTPTKDVNGLLRVNGRLARAESLSFEAKFPLLLPKKQTLTRLIVQNAHETLGHGTGVEHTLTELRARFWIVKGRRVVRDIVSSCKECPRKFSVQTTGQVMAPLPKERLQSLRAFDNVGIDFAGPFLTKQGRGKSRAKRYLCLFTCLATRAVHLEMTYHLDTDSFVNAFTRMTSRRGTPSYVITDNGTNFVGAEREIRGLVQRLEQNKIIEMTGNYQPIEWKFNPPSAPHFGGVFEAMVKSAKRAIKAILGNAEIDDEELHTAICGAEKLLNSRPITYVSSDPQDLTPLTPNHFLVGEVGGIFAPEAMDKVEAYHPVKRWHRVQQLLQHFWKRWQREFLPQLNLRKKWFHPRHNIAVGDVVLVAEPRNNRGEWPLARIVEVFPDENGMVRVVKLWSNGKEFKRPVHRLCPLEYVDQKDDA